MEQLTAAGGRLMFADVDPTRPWPATDMTTRRWLTIPTRRVLVGDLTATQDGIHLAPLLQEPASSWCGDPAPHVIAWAGRLYLEDGHHRAVRAVLNGRRDLHARVLVIGGAR